MTKNHTHQPVCVAGIIARGITSPIAVVMVPVPVATFTSISYVAIPRCVHGNPNWTVQIPVISQSKNETIAHCQLPNHIIVGISYVDIPRYQLCRHSPIRPCTCHSSDNSTANCHQN